MAKINYVLMIVVDPQSKTAVGLIKNKGPEFLIGKFTFPGGKIEPGESVEAAASRELLEEAGVVIPEDGWQKVGFTETAEYTLHVVGALSDQVAHAKQMEEELIFVMDLQEHYSKALRYGSRYTPDFIEIVDKAMEKLGIALDKSPDFEKANRWGKCFAEATMPRLRKELKEISAVAKACGSGPETDEMLYSLRRELRSRAARKAARTRKRNRKVKG